MSPRVMLLVALISGGLLYWFPVRRWYRHWGATDEEIARTMPGDADVTRATCETTLAVTVRAPAADIWPWLVQMGFRRGGLYCP